MAAALVKIRVVQTVGNSNFWLSKASKLLEDHKYHVEWMDGIESQELINEDYTYILETFDCPCYKLLHGRCRILGAPAVVGYLERGRKLPVTTNQQSVYALSMSSVHITCTSVPRETRKVLFERVRQMGGVADGDLTKRTTHLICGEVQSLKYKIAIKAGIPVMLPSWIDHAWHLTVTSNQIIDATSEDIMKEHMCGVFQGLVVCVTGFAVDKRKEIQDLTKHNGGTYSGEMKKDDCTHLLVDAPKGQKYEFARKWQLATVHSRWFFDSLKAGVCLPEEGYLVRPPDPEPTSVSHSQPWAVLLSEFTPSSNINTSLLEGLRIYLSGFLRPHVEKTTSLMLLLGASRLKQIHPSVTHVLIGQEEPEEMSKLRKLKSSASIVRVEWLLDCCQSGSRVDEAAYTVTMATPDNLPSRTERSDPIEEGEDEDDIMKMYLNDIQQDDAMEVDIHQGDEMEVDNGDVAKKPDVLAGQCFDISPSLKDGQKRRVVEMIAAFGGTIGKPAKFIVTPLYVLDEDYDKIFEQAIPVTICWLESIEEGREFLSPKSHLLFQPIRGQINTSALNGCSVYISQFDGLQRTYLQMLAGKLGARVMPQFHKECTHLILREPSGEKYKAAMKWGVLTVRDTWLLECARDGSRALERDHNVISDIPQNPLHDPPQGEPPQNPPRKPPQDPTPKLPVAAAPFSSDTITPFKPMKPAFNTSAALKTLQSPLSQAEVNTQQLGEMFSSALKKAADNFDVTLENDGVYLKDATLKKPLNGVAIFVHKKLVKKQSELHRIARNLGAEIKWNYCDSCTHVLYQGKENDFSRIKDLKQAKSSNCYIVSPHWMEACHNAGERVDEAQFPCDFTPQLQVSGLCTKRVAGQVFKAASPPTLHDEEAQHTVINRDISHPVSSSLVVIDKAPPMDTTKPSTEGALRLEDGEEQLKGQDREQDREQNGEQDREQNGEQDREQDGKQDGEQDREQNGEQDREQDGKQDGEQDGKQDGEQDGEQDREQDGEQDGENKAEEMDESSTLQEREEFQRQMEEMGMKYQMQNSATRRSHRLQEKDKIGERQSKRLMKKKSFTSAHKRRKVTLDDDDSNLVAWDFSSQTVTYEHPMTKIGQQQIMEMIRNAGANNTADQAKETEEKEDAGGSKSRGEETEEPPVAAEQVCAQDKESLPKEPATHSTPLPPPLKVPIVTRGESTSSNASHILYEQQPRATSGLRPRNVQHKFMFSGITQEARNNYSILVSELGGQSISATHYDPSCTHMVVGKASRNEKYLASIAAGRWVLHVSYLEACKEARCFVEESAFEWGSNRLDSELSPLDKAAKSWRLSLEEKRKVTGKDVGAFQGWKALLVVADKEKMAGVKRLLEAGHAEVVGIRDPYRKFKEATHAFIDMGKTGRRSVKMDHIREWRAAGVTCLKPEYIAEYLTHCGSVNARPFTLETTS